LSADELRDSFPGPSTTPADLVNTALVDPPAAERPPVERSGLADAQRPEKATGVFISYRRDDESNFAGRLFERLLRSVDTDKVFMDVDSIDLGVDFIMVIDRWLDRCSVMLVVIGTNWLNAGGRTAVVG
jgi:hypothetical protein